MTLFFDINILEQDTKCDPIYLVTALHKFYKGITIPKNSREKYKPLRRLKAGSNFLINPEPLFNDNSVDSLYKAQYIRLAARRNYLQYKLFGDTTLDLTLYPDINLQAIQFNPLLSTAQKQLKFKYEGSTNGN